MIDEKKNKKNEKIVRQTMKLADIAPTKHSVSLPKTKQTTIQQPINLTKRF